MMFVCMYSSVKTGDDSFHSALYQILELQIEMQLLLLYFLLPVCHSYRRRPRKDRFCTLREVPDTPMPGNTLKYGACYHVILRTDVIFQLNGTQFIV